MITASRTKFITNIRKIQKLTTEDKFQAKNLEAFPFKLMPAPSLSSGEVSLSPSKPSKRNKGSESPIVEVFVAALMRANGSVPQAFLIAAKCSA